MVEMFIAEGQQMATSMLVLLVKGIFTKLSFPYVQFPCTALSGDQLYDPLGKLSVVSLELCDFKVLGLTCDGLAANRRLFRLHDPGNKSLVHKVSNPFATDDRYLYFLVDPPHLLKTVRNAWANNKRKLWVSYWEVKPNY